jgi:hypothetical protein
MKQLRKILKDTITAGLVTTPILVGCRSMQTDIIPSNMSKQTIQKTQRNLLSPITRNGITSGTIDYVIEVNGNVILDESQIYTSSKANKDERWVPFLDNGKIKGHYVGTDDDLKIRLSGKQGIYADQDHQVLSSTEGNSNKGLYTLGVFTALAAGYGISRFSKRKASTTAQLDEVENNLNKNEEILQNIKKNSN